MRNRSNRALWVLLGILFVLFAILWLVLQAVGAVLSFIFSLKGIAILLVIFGLYLVLKRRK